MVRWVVIVVLVLVGAADLLLLNLVAYPRYVEEHAQATAPNQGAEVPAVVPDEPPTPDAPTPTPPLPPPAADGEPPVQPQGDASTQPEAPPAVQEPSEPQPQAGAPPPPEPVMFLSGASAVRILWREQLDEVVDTMRRRPELRVLLRGHTDNRGYEVRNMGLSQHRAEAVADILVEGGIDRGRIDVEWVGETQPADSRNFPRALARNRRVEVIWR